MEKKKKRLWIISGSIVGVLILITVIAMFSIGALVKAGVNTVLPQITGTPCSIGMCTFNPIMGKVTMRNFIIGNPEGYAHPNAFKMGRLVIDVGMTSLFSEKIVIEKIIIDNMEVDFEVKLTETNLSTIKGNVDEFTKTDIEEKEVDEKTETEEKPAKSKKLQIDLFKFVNSNIIMGTAGQTVTVPLADIVIENIGNSQKGATVGEVSEKVFYALYDSILETVKEQTIKINGKSIKGVADKMVKGVKGWFGSGDKKK